MAGPTATRPSLLVRLRDPQDDAAWETFVELYQPLLYRVARHRGLQSSDADEVVQDVLCELVRLLPQYESSGRTGSFRRWLRVIAQRRAINRLLRDARHRAAGDGRLAEPAAREADDPSAQLLEKLEEEWRRQTFIAASQHVRSRCDATTWAAFWSTTVEGRDAHEVAVQLGLTVGTVYVARSRIQARIRQWVEQHAAAWEGGAP